MSKFPAGTRVRINSRLLEAYNDDNNNGSLEPCVGKTGIVRDHFHWSAYQKVEFDDGFRSREQNLFLPEELDVV